MNFGEKLDLFLFHMQLKIKVKEKQIEGECSTNGGLVVFNIQYLSNVDAPTKTNHNKDQNIWRRMKN